MQDTERWQPEFRRHTGIGYRFVEEEEKIIVNFNYIKH
jgi:hypothetical protein